MLLAKLLTIGGHAALDAYIDSLSQIRPLEYRFDEAAGNIINYGSAGSALNGTLTLGSGLRQQSGLLGNCLYFDGDTTKILIPSHSSISGASFLQFVILCKPETAGEGNTGVFFDDAGARKTRLIFNNVNLALSGLVDGATTDATVAPNVNLTANENVGLSFKYNDATDKLIFVHVNSFEAPYSARVAATGALVAYSGGYIGNSVFGNQGWKGWMHRFYIFTQELTSEQLKNIHRLANLPYDEGGTVPIGGNGTFGSDLVIGNAGFELGLNGWTPNITVVSGFTGSITSVTSEKNSGLRSARFATSNTGVSVANNAELTRNAPTLTANSYYQLRMSYKSLSITNLFLSLRNTGSTIFKTLVAVSDTDRSAWDTLVFNFKTPASADTWVIRNSIGNTPNGQSFESFVDDISITPISALSQEEFTIAAIGDSQVSHLGISATTENDNAGSFLSTSIRRIMLSPNHLLVIPPLNKGVAGNRSSDVVARIQADVVDAIPKPTYCYIAVGTNDAAASFPVTTTRDNIQAAADICIAGGVTPIIFTIVPRTDAINVEPYNVLLRALAPTYQVYDAYATAMADPNWSTYIADGVHYNSFGHVLLGKGVGDYMLANLL